MSWKLQWFTLLGIQEHLNIRQMADILPSVVQTLNIRVGIPYILSVNQSIIECFSVLELWKLQPAQEFLVINGKIFQKWIKAIRCIEWSNDSERIVCGTESGVIVILSACTLRTLHKIQKHNHRIRCMRYSPNGQYLATADTQGHIYVFHSKQYKVFMCFRTKSGEISFDWHPWSGVDLAICKLNIFKTNLSDLKSFQLRNRHHPFTFFMCHAVRWLPTISGRIRRFKYAPLILARLPESYLSMSIDMVRSIQFGCLLF